MDEQRKIAWLQQYRAGRWELERIHDEIAHWTSRGQRVTSMISDLPRGGEKEDRLQQAVERVEELKERLLERYESILALQAEIESAVEAVEDYVLRELLKSRYYDHLTWEKIGERLLFGSRQVYRLHSKALAAIRIPEQKCESIFKGCHKMS